MSSKAGQRADLVLRSIPETRREVAAVTRLAVAASDRMGRVTRRATIQIPAASNAVETSRRADRQREPARDPNASSWLISAMSPRRGRAASGRRRPPARRGRRLEAAAALPTRRGAMPADRGSPRAGRARSLDQPTVGTDEVRPPGRPEPGPLEDDPVDPLEAEVRGQDRDPLAAAVVVEQRRRDGDRRPFVSVER